MTGKWRAASPSMGVARWLALLLVSALAACVTPPPPVTDVEALFLDQHFKAPDEVPDATRVFAPSPAMQAYLAGEMGQATRRQGALPGLVEALYGRQQLKLDYDAAYTRNAAEAFDARSGNCLSLVIMTSAFAQALGLPVQYQRVLIDQRWRLAGDLMLGTGHVNLGLGDRVPDPRGGARVQRAVTIDFLPPDALERQRMWTIDQATIVGMYMNNRAAETLAEGRLDQAYWWAREAVRQAPAEMAGYNTLAVIYQRRGRAGEAERVFRYALAKEPDNTRLLANLAQLLQKQGRQAESQTMARRLLALEPVPPYRDFMLGRAALREGRYDAARALFEQELARSPEQAEPHFGLAQAHLALGHLALARQHLALARDLSATRGEQALYSAKLERLPALRDP